MLSFMVSWFGNGTPQLSVPTTTLQTMLHLFSHSWQLDRRIGDTADKDHELREDKFTENSSEVRKLTVRVTIVIQNEQERGLRFMCLSPRRTPDNTWPCYAVLLGRDPSVHPGKWCEVLWNSLRSTVKINPVMAGTRTHEFFGMTLQKQALILEFLVL